MGKKKKRYRPPMFGTVDQLLHEALLWHYWGAHGYARDMLVGITEKVLSNDQESGTEASSPSQTGKTDDGNDDHDYPWDNWQYNERFCRREVDDDSRP